MKRNRKIWLALLMVTAIYIQAQDSLVKKSYGGMFSLGMRNVVSAFNDGAWNNAGVGCGGQFLLQASNRVNTAWFFDYIKGGIGDYANRTDYHIGWSVMYYLIPSSTVKQPKFQPFVLAGHCFDYTNLKDNNNSKNFAERWSSAVQAGVGTHCNLSRRIDVFIQAQYMIHLSNDIDADKENGKVVFTKESGINLVGHLLISFGINCKIVDLWKGK